jgi:hypothetical protein
MKFTALTREILAIRRDRRDMTKAGWEHVGERGGRLWELYRGGRTRHRITDVRVARDGRSLWIKTAIHETLSNR